MADNEINEQQERNEGGNGWLRGLLIAGVAVGAAALTNAFIFYKTPPLTSQLSGGEVRYFPTTDGDVFYKKAGDGPPLLLVHGIGAGSSSYEWKEVWDSLTEKYTVYALDLLGFGKSDKPEMAYTAEKYVALLDDFCRRVIKVGDGRGECDVIATSLSAAYVIALSARDPLLFRRLVLVCPTGIEDLATPPSDRAEIGRTVLSAPVLGTTIYNAIASKAGIRKYMTSRLFAKPATATDEMVDQYHTAAHQPGGENALPSFLSGMLNISVAEAWTKVVDLPLLVWGRESVETPVGQAEPFLLANPQAKLEVIEDAGMLPHVENPEAFLAAVRPFLAESEGESDAADTLGGEFGEETESVGADAVPA